MKWDIFKETQEVLREMGGKGSGHYRHRGRKGKRGGSTSSKGVKTATKGFEVQNKVSNYSWDEKHQSGRVEVNETSFVLYRPEIGWDAKNFRPRLGFGIQAANDWNQSNRIKIESNTLKNLIRKIEKHEYRLVKPVV